MGEHFHRVSVVEVLPPPVRVTRLAQYIESKPASTCARKNINGLPNKISPTIARNIPFDIEYAARDREVRNFRRLCAYPPLMVLALAVKLSRLLNHAGGYVVADKAALVAGGAKKAQEVTETTAKIYNRRLQMFIEQAKKLLVT